MTRATSLWSVYLDWQSVSSFPLCKDSKGIPQGLHCVSPRSPCLSWWISRPVFMCAKIPHEMFFWSSANHVIHVTQEDRFMLSLCTFLHVRQRNGYQLVITQVVYFLCAVSLPGLTIILESLKLFLQSPTLEESNFASGTGSTYTGSDSHGIGDG